MEHSSGAIGRRTVKVGHGRSHVWVIAFLIGVGVGVLGAKIFVEGAIVLGIVALVAAAMVCGVAVNRLDRTSS
jgi:hypothetical protein